MISRKRLKERLIDICNGAGYRWIDDGGYFESDDYLLSVGLAIQGIEDSFGLGAESRLRTPWRLKDFGTLDSLADLVDEAIRFDKND